MNILLMSVRAGYGHHSTANAVMECFSEHGHKCAMLDIFDYISRHLGNSIQDGYLISTKYFSETYGKIYGKMSQKVEPYAEKSMVTIVSELVSEKLTGYIYDFEPDLIIGTHSYAGMVMSILREKQVFSCPTIGIVTDFTVHPFWESTFLDYYVTPDELLNYEMMKKGIEKKRILPIGIPVRKQFAKKSGKREARRALGIEDMKTALVIMGSMGYGNIKKTLMEMDEYPTDFQILCVCGSNARVKAAVDGCVFRKKVYSYGFVDNVDVMMDAADFIVSKPGGLTTSEAFAKGLPMIVMNPLPGQEDRNTDFLVNSGAVIAVNERYTVSEALHQLLGCEWREQLLKESIAHIGKPNATEDLYKFAAENLWAVKADKIK